MVMARDDKTRRGQRRSRAITVESNGASFTANTGGNGNIALTSSTGALDIGGVSHAAGLQHWWRTPLRLKHRSSATAVHCARHRADVIGVEAIAQIFNITDAETYADYHQQTITIGDVAHTGNISVARQNAIVQGAKNITLVNQGATTSDIAIKGNNDFHGEEPDAQCGGAITQAAGTGKLITQNAGDLVLTATKGIGTLAAPVIIGTVAGNLSADNQTGATAGDISLKTGTLTIGSVGTNILERSTGTIQINATNAATDSLTVGGDISAPGAGGTIILNAGTGGTITRTGGTLTASTVQLGVTSAQSVGASGTPIVTAATTLLDARAGAGDVWVSNTGNVNATAQATGGLVNLLNSGTLTTATPVITSSTSSVTVSSTDNMSIGHNVSAGGTGTVNLSVSVAQKQLSHTAGTISTGNGAINLTADNMSLAAGANTIAAGSGKAINVTTTTAGNPIDLGSALGPTSGKLELSAAELLEFQTTGVLTVGNIAHTGQISVTAAVATTGVTGGTTLVNNTNGIAINNVLTSGRVRRRLP